MQYGNKFRYSIDNKRYHTLNYYNKTKFGCRIYKAVIDAGFSCPNKDGTKGYGGCIFCYGGSGYFTSEGSVPVEVQLKREIKRIRSKTPDAKIIAYFQANTNTYGSLERLREVYEPIVDRDDIFGISIGTRADCLDGDICRYLEDISKRTHLTVELGLQSSNDRTAELINRGYSYSEFLKGFDALSSRNIRTCIHIINGLPGENEENMLKTAEDVGRLKPEALKIQLLHVIKGTRLEEMYNNHEFDVMTMEDYINITVKQLEYIPTETVIERITGDGDRKNLIAPLWSTNKIAVLGGIDKRQAETGSMQGIKVFY